MTFKYYHHQGLWSMISITDPTYDVIEYRTRQGFFQVSYLDQIFVGWMGGGGGVLRRSMTSGTATCCFELV